MEVKEQQSLNTVSLIILTLEPVKNRKSDIFLHPLKAPAPISTKFIPIKKKELKLTHPSKAFAPILLTEDGNSTSVNFSQP